MKFKSVVIVWSGNELLVSRHYASKGYIRKTYSKNGKYSMEEMSTLNLDIHGMDYRNTISYLRNK